MGFVSVGEQLLTFVTLLLGAICKCCSASSYLLQVVEITSDRAGERKKRKKRAHNVTSVEKISCANCICLYTIKLRLYDRCLIHNKALYIYRAGASTSLPPA